MRTHYGSFDYIVVGSGSAGAVVAARLAEGGQRSVLVLEAGESDRREVIDMPIAWFRAMRTPDLGWGYMSEPEAYANDRRIPAPRGKVVGGCAAINGMMYSRGNPRDYDDWAQSGCAGWSFDDVLPYFRKSESNWRGASKYHGDDGPITVARHQHDDTVFPAIIEAAQALGQNAVDDFHGVDTEGWSVPDFTIHGGKRGSPSARMLRPALKNDNLRLATDAQAERIVFEAGRASSIEFRVGGVPAVAAAQREIIVCAGAFNTPHLLMHSGIGPADHLRDFGITVENDLPGVGENLQDHASIGMLYQASGDFTFDRQLRADRFALSLLRWKLLGQGPLAGLPVGAQGFVRTREGLDRPDLQLLVSPVAMDAHVWFPFLRKARGDFLTISNVLLGPESRGRIRLKSADPMDLPAVHLNLLQAPADRQAFRRFVRFTRTLLATDPANGLVDGEVMPGAGVQTDDEIDSFVRGAIGTAMHPTSSCAMGTGPMAVVDPQLRVHGTQGLRVVDCSVMPNIVGGNTNAPAIMIAEKAADMILGKTPLPAEDVGPHTPVLAGANR